MILNKQIPREFRKNFFRYIAVLILLVIGISVVTGYNCASRSVRAALSQERESGNTENGDFQTFAPLSDTQIAHIRQMGFHVEKQFYYDEKKSGKTLRLFAIRKNINCFQRVEGSSEINGDEILLDKMYAAKNDYRPGDLVTVNGSQKIVKGSGCVPDYILIISDLTSNSSNAKKFGLGFIKQSEFDQLPIEGKTWNYAFRYRENWDKHSQESHLSKLRTYLKDECQMTGFVKNDESTRVIGIFSKLDGDKSTALMLGVVIMLIIAVLFYSMTKSTIIKECSAIGTLYAQGYRRREIRRYYLKLPLILTCFGTIIGYLLGSHKMMQPLIASSYAFYCIPKVTLATSHIEMLATIVFPIVMVWIINEIGLNRILRSDPLPLIRKDIRETRGIEPKLNRFSFIHRFRIRILLKTIADNLLLICVVILSCLLMTMGFGMNDSISQYLQKVKGAVPSQYTYILNSEFDVHSNHAEKFRVQQFQYDFKTADTKMPITCYGLQNNSNYFDMNMPGDKELVLSRAAADKFGFKKGDTIKLVTADGQNHYRLKITGIYHYPIGLYAFMNMESLNRLLNKPTQSYNAWFSNKRLTIGSPYQSSLITRKQTIKSAQQYYEMTADSAKLMIAAAIVISVILMLVLFGMVIDKNQKEISMAKVLGYSDKELNRIYIGGKILVIIFALLISIPLDLALMKAIWPSLILTFRGFMPFAVSRNHIAAIVVIELAAYALIRWITAMKLKRVTLNEVLKDRE